MWVGGHTLAPLTTTTAFSSRHVTDWPCNLLAPLLWRVLKTKARCCLVPASSNSATCTLVNCQHFWFITERETDMSNQPHLAARAHPGQSLVMLRSYQHVVKSVLSCQYGLKLWKMAERTMVELFRRAKHDFRMVSVCKNMKQTDETSRSEDDCYIIHILQNWRNKH